MLQDWSKCVDTKRGDGHNFTEECRDPTLNLQQCMEEHRDYYQVQLFSMPLSRAACIVQLKRIQSQQKLYMMPRH